MLTPAQKSGGPGGDTHLSIAHWRRFGFHEIDEFSLETGTERSATPGRIVDYTSGCRDENR